MNQIIWMFQRTAVVPSQIAASPQSLYINLVLENEMDMAEMGYASQKNNINCEDVLLRQSSSASLQKGDEKTFHK